MTTTIKSLRAALAAILAILTGTATVMAADEFDAASQKDIIKAGTIEGRFQQTTADHYYYLYTLRFNLPRKKGDKPTVTIENPSLPDVIYTIEKAAGSNIRKELWCRDSRGQEVRIVLKYEEKPGARNATDLKLYVDKYPGSRENQKSIDATKVYSCYSIKKNYDRGSVLLCATNSMTGTPKKWKAAHHEALFEWLDANVPGCK